MTRYYDFKTFDHWTKVNTYAVRMYKRNGDGFKVAYTATLEEAKEIRTNHGLAIGLELEPTYKDFAYYPTIWEWNDETKAYERLLGY